MTTEFDVDRFDEDVAISLVSAHCNAKDRVSNQRFNKWVILNQSTLNYLYNKYKDTISLDIDEFYRWVYISSDWVNVE
jgi:hypothetical protein